MIKVFFTVAMLLLVASTMQQISTVQYKNAEFLFNGGLQIRNDKTWCLHKAVYRQPIEVRATPKEGRLLQEGQDGEITLMKAIQGLAKTTEYSNIKKLQQSSVRDRLKNFIRELQTRDIFNAETNIRCFDGKMETIKNWDSLINEGENNRSTTFTKGRFYEFFNNPQFQNLIMRSILDVYVTVRDNSQAYDNITQIDSLLGNDTFTQNVLNSLYTKVLKVLSPIGYGEFKCKEEMTSKPKDNVGAAVYSGIRLSVIFRVLLELNDKF